MPTLLSILKWTFWAVAGCLAGLVLVLTLIGRGADGATDLLLSLLYCAVAASPGLLIHLAQKRL